MKPFLPLFVLNKLNNSYQQREFDNWQKAGCPAPPPHFVKQMAIEDYQRKSGYHVFIETGTFLGDMVEAQKDRFNKIISIELAGHLYRKAKKRFRNNEKVTIVQGDSGKVLPEILNNIHEPVVFWLDGHYSAGVTAKGDKSCPIYEEIDAIFNRKNQFNHIILIDDARLFTGKRDYPEVVKVTGYIRAKNSNYQLEIKDDILCYWVN
ncbi:MAG: hypothetical protein ABJC12_00135 [Saprospiraceae bacterium]